MTSNIQLEHDYRITDNCEIVNLERNLQTDYSNSIVLLMWNQFQKT